MQPANDDSVDEDEIDPIAMEQALKRMGNRAKEEAFAAGLTVLVVREGHMVKLFADGREEEIGIVQDTIVTEPR